MKTAVHALTFLSLLTVGLSLPFAASAGYIGNDRLVSCHSAEGKEIWANEDMVTFDNEILSKQMIDWQTSGEGDEQRTYIKDALTIVAFKNSCEHGAEQGLMITDSSNGNETLHFCSMRIDCANLSR